MRNDRLPRLVLAVAVASALWAAGCRCGSSPAGKIGKAVTAMDAVPADVDAVIVANIDSLRRSSLGEFAFKPWVLPAMESWGGAPCRLLPAKTLRSAVIGARLAREGQRAREFFFAYEGATIADLKACVDEHDRRQGLSPWFESVAGIRDLADTEGLHILAAGERVAAQTYPFNDRGLLEQMAKVVDGQIPSLSTNANFRDLLGRLRGDITVALPDTTQLFATYGDDLENALVKLAPPDLCAGPTDVGLVLAMASTQGFGKLEGLSQFVKTHFADAEKICLADVVRLLVKDILLVRAAGVTLGGQADLELGVMLLFADETAAAEIRSLLVDVVYAFQNGTQGLDNIERDFPTVMAEIQKHINVNLLRNTLRNPLLRNITVGGEGTTVDLQIRVDEADVKNAVESTQQTLTQLIATD